ncbi:hypothetical protein O6H91_18G083900 [Diphasiastrum complanatum]|uniref:Uncharacterized protein n=1 Tax=Diphasiastrum complanatum TaxID=34168 RepID=A0ACC2B3C0_DIPCM|nr:hypothetical protein O6H91_18G083900 [Diphasiastrum complanatum]
MSTIVRELLLCLQMLMFTIELIISQFHLPLVARLLPYHPLYSLWQDLHGPFTSFMPSSAIQWLFSSICQCNILHLKSTSLFSWCHRLDKSVEPKFQIMKFNFLLWSSCLFGII